MKQATMSRKPSGHFAVIWYEAARVVVDIISGSERRGDIEGVFLLLDLVPHLVEEFGGTPIHLNLLPFDPAWVTIIISGIPLLYLAGGIKDAMIE